MISSLFLRSLGLLVAFQFFTTSWQLKPIIGSNGIEPVHKLIHAFRRDHGILRGFLKLPTIFWVNCSNWFIQSIAIIGTLLALSFALGLTGDYQGLVVFALWFLWLSILNAAPNFFYFPWDLLLLETLLITTFAPPLAFVTEPTSHTAFSPILNLAYAVLLFRVMLGMGLSKFREQDARTRDGTYIYHFLNWQPMATDFARWVRQLPMIFHRLSLRSLMLIECVFPFFLFGPSALRYTALAGFVGLQAFIMACGNYGIFNILTALLALVCLNFEPASLMTFSIDQFGHWVLLLHCVIGIPHLIFLNSWTSNVWTYFQGHGKSPSRILPMLQTVFRQLKPFAIWHGYGIFLPRGNFGKVLSIIQMQDAQGQWHDVQTRYLTGPVDTRPPRFAPYHPRLDHHLFYVHLRPRDLKIACIMGTHPYYVHPVGVIDKLVQHLYQQTPEVLALFKSVPLSSPRAIRIAVYEYHLLPPEKFEKEGVYWSREFLCATESFPQLQPSEATGIQPSYDPFVFSHFGQDADGYSTVEYGGTEVRLNRIALKPTEDNRAHPYFANE